MASKRLARLNEQLKREIAGLLQTEVRDPRVGLVSITGVKVAADLMSARVFVSLIGSAADKEESLEGLRAAAPFLRRTLGRSLHLRRVPELRFQEDTSLAHGQRIEKILQEVLPEGAEPPSEPEDAETPSEPSDGEEAAEPPDPEPDS